MIARTIQLPQERITVWVYSPRAFDVKIRHQQVRSFRNGRPVPRPVKVASGWPRYGVDP